MDRVNKISVDEHGHILIPEKVWRRQGMKPGMTLIAEKGDNDGVRLRPKPDQPRLVDKGGVLVARTEPLTDLSNITQRERDQRVVDLLDRIAL